MVKSADNVSVRCSLCPSWLATEVQCSLNSLMCTQFGRDNLRESGIVRVRTCETPIESRRSYLVNERSACSDAIILSGHIIIGITCKSTHLDLDSSSQSNIPTARTNVDRVLAALQLPLLRNHIPNAQIPPSDRESDLLSGAASDVARLEPTKLLCRSRCNVDIQLRNFFGSHGAGVLDVHGDLVEDFPKIGRTTLGNRDLFCGVLVGVATKGFDREIGVGESGVGQAVAELEPRSDVVLVEVPVIDVEAFGEVGLWVRTRANSSVEKVAVVRLVLGDRERHTSGRRDITVKDVSDRVTDLLARQTSIDDGGDVRVLDPLINGSDASIVDDHDGVGAVGSNILYELVAELILQ
jgi:hypothetical protein